MSHISLVATPPGGKIYITVKPHLLYRQLDGIYAVLIAISCKTKSQVLVLGLVGSQTHLYIEMSAVC